MKALRHVLIYVLGGVLGKILPFLLLPYFTRALGVEGVAELGVFQSVVALIVIFVSLNQEGAVSRYYYRYGTQGILNVLYTGALLNIVMLTLLCVIFVILGQIEYLFLIICASSQSILSSLLAFYNAHKKPLTYLIGQVGASSLAAVFTFLVFEYYVASPDLRICVVLFANALFALILYLMLPNNRFNHRKIKLYARYILGFGLPLIIHKISLYGKGQFDRLLLAFYITKADLAVYNVGSQLAGAVFVIVVAVNKATVPFYYELIKKKKVHSGNVSKLALMALIPSVFSFFVFSLFPTTWYGAVFGEEFFNVKKVFTYMAPGYILYFPYYLYVNFLYYHGQTMVVSKVSLISSVMHVSILFSFVYFGFRLEFLASVLALSNLILCFLIYLAFKKWINNESFEKKIN